MVENKPSPEPYLTAYLRFNLNANECLIVEDSVSGIASAKASGGNVLEVSDVHDVTLSKLLKRIEVIQ